MPSPARPTDPELTQRLEVCGTGTVRGVIIGAVLDGLEKVAGAEARAAVLAQLSSPRYVDFFSYPVSDLVLASYRSAEVLGGDRSTAIRQIGTSLAGPFFQGTPAGRLASSLLSGNVRRYCVGLPAAYTMVSSFGKRSVSFPGEGQCLFAVQDDPIPPQLHAGAIESAGRMLGGLATTTVSFEAHSLLNTTYSIRW